MDFKIVSKVNHDRALVWHPGGLNHWSISDWAVAFAGEAGEVCDAIKKLNRLRDGIQQANSHGDLTQHYEAIANEIGDAYLYLDLLAQALGMDIEECIKQTFNRVSVREGFEHRL